METVLQLFKIDLGINHTVRDEFFTKYLKSQQSVIESKGVTLNLETVEDQMLLSDFAAWNYRKRNEEVGLSRNLELRIRNRIVKGRAADA